jgi:hypothetical protein
MPNWFYETKEIDGLSVKYLNSLDDFPEGTFGFIYQIINLETFQFYIGKKFLHHNKKKKLTKKELAEQSGPGRRATTKVVQEESDWKTYWGSCKELQADIKKLGIDNFERQVLYFAKDKKELTYFEIKHQILEEVLLTPLSYNDNILGKFFKKDFLL